MAATVDTSRYSSYIKLYYTTLSDDFTAGNLTPKLEQESCHVNGKMTPNSAVSHEILFPRFKIQPHCTCFCYDEPLNFQTMHTFPLSH